MKRERGKIERKEEDKAEKRKIMIIERGREKSTGQEKFPAFLYS